LWSEPSAAAEYDTAVSLHGHTNHSKECLSFIADFARKVPALQHALAWEKQRAVREGGICIDFERCYWTPPVSAWQAYGLESAQIHDQLHLQSIVSLTDHENIHAPALLRLLPEAAGTPISLEWTVFVGAGAELHLGIHNLPEREAQALVARMNDCTARKDEALMQELLAALHQTPGVLTVLNHPMWDLCGIGRARLRPMLADFIARYGEFLHAVELGGLRSWEENQRAFEFAIACGLPAVSGGDRHGTEPSACLNLTNAASFAEFAEEVRTGHSHVLFMPQYAEPLAIRYIHTVNDSTATYPGSPLGAKWDERVFHPGHDGEDQPVARLWEKPPAYLGAVLALLRLLEAPPMKRLAQSFGRAGQQLQPNWSGEAAS
jgi:hypothetical protein